MTTTVQDLERRLLVLEQEVARLRVLIEAPEESPAERGARLLRESKANQATISAEIAKVFTDLGITEEPIGAEELQLLFLKEGINPEDNEFSRGIIEMREE